LLHGNSGRSPADRLPDDTRARLVELATSTYAGVNRTHLAELLAEREDLVVASRTMRRVLAEAGVPAVRRRRPRGHRTRRERMSQAGQLLQVDGSRHDWLEGRGPWSTLVGAIDDATGVITGAVFREQKDTAGYFAVLVRTARGPWPAGGPLLRSPHHLLARQGQPQPTPSSSAAAVLGPSWGALWRSPPSPGSAPARRARGSGGALWGTAQDRLITELRLAGASTIDEANAVLADYVPRHNARFAVPPASAESAWRPLPAGRPAEAVFCFRHPRSVARDGTFTLGGRELMIAGRSMASWKGRVLEVQERLDGSLWVEFDGAFQSAVPAPQRPVILRSPGRTRERYVPPPDHPWRRYPAARPRCQSR